MAVTLRDIAKHVNLSHATVSFVLNDRRDVAIPETTRQRVMEAAKQLGYHPNRAARALVMGRTRVVGLWTPPLTSAHLQRVFQGLSDTFRMAGFDSLYSRHSPDFSTHPFEWPVDGIVCVEGSVERHVEPFPEGVPVVVIGSRLLKGLDLVHIDLTAGTVESIMHLLEIGRTRIVCISGEEFDGEGSITHTYCRIMESAGHPSRCLAVRSSNHRQTLSEVRAFLGSNDKFDAVFCASDELSLLTRRALADLRLEIPRDVALVGFNYSDDFEYQVPSLSAVEIPVESVVEFATEMLISRMKDPTRPMQMETVRSRLRILESSKPHSRGYEGSASIL